MLAYAAARTVVAVNPVDPDALIARRAKKASQSRLVSAAEVAAAGWGVIEQLVPGSPDVIPVSFAFLVSGVRSDDTDRALAKLHADLWLADASVHFGAASVAWFVSTPGGLHFGGRATGTASAERYAFRVDVVEESGGVPAHAAITTYPPDARPGVHPPVGRVAGVVTRAIVYIRDEK